MDPTAPDRPGSRTDPDPYTTGSLTPPADPASPAEASRPGADPVHGHHKGHSHWMYLLMCAPMLLVVGYLVLAGRAGGGAILYAVGCLAMMGLMMAMMNHGSGDTSGHHRH